MNMELLFAILIALVPVLLTILAARLYNVIHAVITFLAMQYVLVYCLNMFGATLPPVITDHFPTVLALYNAIDEFVVGLVNAFGFGPMLEQMPFLLLAVYGVVFLISQIIACIIRKHKIEKAKILRRQLKRY